MRQKQRRLSILVADDDPGVRNYIKTALEHFGYRCRTSSSGTAALRLARSGGFGLLVLDYWMGVPNGFEVLMRLRGEGYQGPAILISSGIPDPVRDHCLSERLAYVLDKPFSLDVLQKTIARALEK